MIKFPCICGRQFELEDDQAGTEFQCATCGRLVVVPPINDLHNLKEDGTYVIEVAPLEASRPIEEIHRIFTRDRVNDAGEEIDLRMQPGDFEVLGLTPDEAQNEPQKVAPPRYDPFTGELIKPIELDIAHVPPPMRRFVAAPASRTLDYAQKNIIPRINPWKLLIELFQLHNLVVMIFIFVLHVMFMATLAFMLTLFMALVLLMGLVGHYASVVQETGPGDFDELPRPFRYFNFVEDIWSPFMQTMVAAMLCYLPAVFCLVTNTHVGLVAGMILALAGTYLYPAALLTSSTSGVLANLRYDRILNTALKMQWHYPVIVAAFALGIVGYLGGTVMLSGGLASLLQTGSSSISLLLFPIGATGLMIGIYFLHWGSWYLGLMWRYCHADFGWVGQRYVKPSVTLMKEMTLQQELAKRKYESRQAQRRTMRGLR